MALSEFVAMEAAYRALQPLDAAARGRALHWLTDALGNLDPLPVAESAVSSDGVASVAAPAEQLTGGVVPAAANPDTGESAAEAGTDAEVEAGTDAGTGADADADAGTGADADAEAPAQPSAKAAKSAGRGRRAAAAGPGRGRRGRAAKAPAEPASQERVYRRMPPAEEVLEAYRRVGTISGLAGHFQVPRHTVQGWARRLRRAGYEIGRNA